MPINFSLNIILTLT